MIWFTSDTHFGHTNILSFCGRPWQDILDHDLALIRAWNARVKPGDIVYHLGDFSFHDLDYTQYILDSLDGELHLILGNHDSVMRKCKGIKWVGEYKEIKAGGAKIVMCHYPFASWNGAWGGSWNLHGHSHGNHLATGKQLDVGVDVHSYAPISIDEVQEHMSKL